MRGEDSFLAHEGVEEEVWIGDAEGDAVEPSERSVRTIESVLHLRIDEKRRKGWEGRGMKRPERLSSPLLLEEPACAP